MKFIISLLLVASAISACSDGGMNFSCRIPNRYEYRGKEDSMVLNYSGHDGLYYMESAHGDGMVDGGRLNVIIDRRKNFFYIKNLILIDRDSFNLDQWKFAELSCKKTKKYSSGVEFEFLCRDTEMQNGIHGHFTKARGITALRTYRSEEKDSWQLLGDVGIARPCL
ncbi:hypothetical protein ACQKOH_03335 [Sphingomonas sp. NPDC092331]|nr:hypothetical protein [Pseudomonadota bacterium]